MPRIAIVVSHPIQHFCPMYAKLATSTDWTLHVLFGYAFGAKPYFDKAFAKTIQWDSLRLDEFSHEFLNDDIPQEISPLQIDSDRLETRLDALQPDVLIVYGYIQPLQRRAMRWAQRREKPVLMISDAHVHATSSSLRRVAKEFILPRVLSKLSGCLTVGDSNDAFYRHYHVDAKKLFRSPFPIDIDLYEQSYINRSQLRAEVRKNHLITDDQLALSTVGKFEVGKRQIDLILALERLTELPKNRLVLMLMGSGALESELRAAAERVTHHRVIFAGFVNPGELPPYYAGSDVYAHVSSLDRHPLAISEAIYMGCPVIVSDAIGSVGPTDDVQNGRNGLTFAVGDVDSLALAIRRLALNADLRQQFSQASHDIAVRQQALAHGEGLRHALTAIGLLE